MQHGAYDEYIATIKALSHGAGVQFTCVNEKSARSLRSYIYQKVKDFNFVASVKENTLTVVRVDQKVVEAKQIVASGDA